MDRAADLATLLHRECSLPELKSLLRSLEHGDVIVNHLPQDSNPLEEHFLEVVRSLERQGALKPDFFLALRRRAPADDVDRIAAQFGVTDLGPPPETVAELRADPTKGTGTAGRRGALVAAAALALTAASAFAILVPPALAFEDVTALAHTPTPMSFKALPGGKFVMGSRADEAGRLSTEAAHEETVAPFWIATTEVTQAQYERLVGVNPAASTYAGFALIGETLPVQGVSWLTAIHLANRLSEREGLHPVYTVDGGEVRWDRNADGYRLPTDVEWEYAARGGATTTWPGTASIDEVCAVANVFDQTAAEAFPETVTDRSRRQWAPGACVDGAAGLAPVGSFRANDWRLHDMAGNVQEWTWDWSGAAGGSEGATTAAPIDDRHMARGGSWFDEPAGTRIARQVRHKAGTAVSFIGVRLARSGPAL